MAFEDLLGSDRSMEWISAAVLAGQGFGGTTGKSTIGAGNNSSVILYNPAGSGVKAYVYGLQVMHATGGIFITVADITADPGFTAVAGIRNKQRGATQTSALVMENQLNDVSAAPSAATSSDTILMPANSVFLYSTYATDTLLLPGNGLRIYIPGTSGQFYAVNLDWLEVSN